MMVMQIQESTKQKQNTDTNKKSNHGQLGCISEIKNNNNQTNKAKTPGIDKHFQQTFRVQNYHT